MSVAQDIMRDGGPRRTPPRVGPKVLAGLRAYEHRDHLKASGLSAPFADAILEAEGYHPNVADSIIERLGRADYIEWGVSARSGWLTDRGREVLRANR